MNSIDQYMEGRYPALPKEPTKKERERAHKRAQATRRISIAWGIPSMRDSAMDSIAARVDAMLDKLTISDWPMENGRSFYFWYDHQSQTNAGTMLPPLHPISATMIDEYMYHGSHCPYQVKHRVCAYIAHRLGQYPA